MVAAWKTYDKATAPALRIYREAEAAAWKSYDKAAASAGKSYYDESVVAAGYPTDETRCDSCPRCLPLCPDSPDGNHHVAPIGSDEEWMPSKAPCYYCGERQAS